MLRAACLSKGDLPGTPQYSFEELQAIATEAHKLGRKVAAHAHGTQSIKDAINAGIDSVEHSSLIDDEGIALAKQHGTYLVFDIYNDDFILSDGAKSGMLPESIEKEKKIGRLQRENFRHAYQSGAKIAFGTDAGVYPHGDNARQFSKMVEWGMKPIDAIQAATISAADLIGISDKVGVLEPGHYADLIAVNGDPTIDVKVLENVEIRSERRCDLEERHREIEMAGALSQPPLRIAGTDWPALFHLRKGCSHFLNVWHNRNIVVLGPGDFPMLVDDENCATSDSFVAEIHSVFLTHRAFGMKICQ